jgi:hypothetical protein
VLQAALRAELWLPGHAAGVLQLVCLMGYNPSVSEAPKEYQGPGGHDQGGI